MDIHHLANEHLEKGVSMAEIARREHVSQLRLKRLLVEAGYTPRNQADAAALSNRQRDWSEFPTICKFEAQRRLRHRKRDIVRAFRAKGCEKCGEAHPAALDLHHRDPSTKHPKLQSYVTGSGRGRLGGRGWVALSYADIETELTKCQVLCSNCHRKEEWEAREREAS
jgi:hypothetical protein